MKTLPTRQVHLDYHTSPLIPGVGSAFDKEKFQSALREGRVNSVTVFAKCLHGNCYYPTKIGRQHPTMTSGFDLTGAMVDAAHELGIRAPIYITAGWSAYDAEEHPEWRKQNRDGSYKGYQFDFNASPDDPKPTDSWADLCFSGEYLKYFYALEEEIVDRYPVVDGLFIDIVYMDGPCFCPNCVKGMRSEGLDPASDRDAEEYDRRVHLRFMDECTRILHKKHPDASIVFNSGGAEVYHPEYHRGQSHFELEYLSATRGGFNVLPGRASYMSRYGKEMLHMTGKFHTEWGEVGGYKNPEGLKYEMLNSAMFGAKSSIGEHLLPDGTLEPATWKLIGHVYETVEKLEDWLWPSRSTAELAVYLSGDPVSDQGAYDMLLESHIDFDVIDREDSLDPYKALILPDCAALTDGEAERVNAFIQRGGAVFFSGVSAVKDGKFQLDPGAEYLGEPTYQQDFFFPTEKLPLPYANAPIVCYESARRTSPTDGEVLAWVYEPWFDRTYGHYSDARNAPYRNEHADHPAAVKKGKVVYFAHSIFRLYRARGMQLYREMAIRALRTVYTPRYSLPFPSAGHTRLTYQPEKRRYVFQTLCAFPTTRGGLTVVEDIVPLYQVPVEIALPETVKAVKTVPAGEAIPFTQENGTLRFTLPKVELYGYAEIDV